MVENFSWRETESVIHRPGWWILWCLEAFACLASAGGLLVIDGLVPPGLQLTALRVMLLVILLTAVMGLGWLGYRLLHPFRTFHAPCDLLPEVPCEPVMAEGSVVHGRLSHEIVDSDSGLEFRPSTRLIQSDRLFLWGFGIPFLIGFAGLLTWVVHHHLPWPSAALVGISVTLLCGGTTFTLIAMVVLSSYRRLTSLRIPDDGGDLQLDSALAPDPASAGPADGLKWLLTGEGERNRLTIPRDRLIAVQLCPWKFVIGGPRQRSITWAVQGNLVVSNSLGDACHRLPLLLTSDFVGAARLMGQLGQVLQVPYLYCADRAGWKAETHRAKTRPPLESGGFVS